MSFSHINQMIKLNYSTLYSQMVAACDLNPGDVILVEQPLVCGPGNL